MHVLEIYIWMVAVFFFSEKGVRILGSMLCWQFYLFTILFILGRFCEIRGDSLTNCSLIKSLGFGLCLRSSLPFCPCFASENVLIFSHVVLKNTKRIETNELNVRGDLSAIKRARACITRVDAHACMQASMESEEPRERTI